MLPVVSHDMAKQETETKLREAERARRASGFAKHRRPQSILKSLRTLLARI
jgi:hypothetical protein